VSLAGLVGQAQERGQRDDEVLQGRVLAVDWVPSRPERPEGLIVVYDGGVLSDSEIKEIVLADGELAGFAFVARDDVAGLVTPLLTRRVASCLDAVIAGAVVRRAMICIRLLRGLGGDDGAGRPVRP
jgi:hypothetical protein